MASSQKATRTVFHMCLHSKLVHLCQLPSRSLIAFAQYYPRCLHHFARRSPSFFKRPQRKEMDVHDYSSRVSAHRPMAEYSLGHCLCYAFYAPLYLAGPTLTFNAFVSHVSPVSTATAVLTLTVTFCSVAVSPTIDLLVDDTFWDFLVQMLLTVVSAFWQGCLCESDAWESVPVTPV